jgi:hypothetical protein
MLSGEGIHKHVFANLLNKISTYLVDNRHILQTITLGNVATPNRLIDGVRVNTLNDIAKECFEHTRVDVYCSIFVLSLRIVTNFS